MDKNNKASIEMNAMPPMDPRMMAAMYGMPEEDEIDLLEYWHVIWKRKWLIVGFSLLAAVIAAAVALQMPNMYKAEVLLSPISDGSKGGGLSLGGLGGLGGLASLAGVSLGSGGGSTEVNLAVLKTRDFLWKFIKKEQLMPILFEDAWDAEQKIWKELDIEKQPTLWDAYRVMNGIISVSSDKKTGLVTFSIEWTDADLAAKWANLLVNRLNEYLRKKALSEGAANLTYLKKELARSQVEDVRKTLFSLIAKEQQKAMLANTRVQYAFSVVDKAVSPDKKSKPKRALIVILATFVAGFLAIIFVFIQEGLRKRKEMEQEE